LGATGSLIFYGRFALSIGSYGFSIGHYGSADVEVYLERCGTHLHRLVTKAATPDPADTLLPAANTHEVVWMAHPRPFLSALILPGLKPFTIRLPKRLIASACSPDYYLSCVSQIALTNHRLYLLTASYPSEVWAAPIPLPANASTNKLRSHLPSVAVPARIAELAWLASAPPTS
jgi:hypothetical protein